MSERKTGTQAAEKGTYPEETGLKNGNGKAANDPFEGQGTLPETTLAKAKTEELAGKTLFIHWITMDTGEYGEYAAVEASIGKADNSPVLWMAGASVIVEKLKRLRQRVSKGQEEFPYMARIVQVKGKENEYWDLR